MSEGLALAIFFAKGDLGDVGRHAVAAALELPPWLVSSIRVFSPHIDSLNERNWNCACPDHVLSGESRSRLELFPIDCASDDIIRHLVGVDTVVSCLGNREPCGPEQAAQAGTQRLVHAVMAHGIRRFIMISSVGVAEDWPPMPWSSDGERLAGRFQRICRKQYLDLNAAEAAVREGLQIRPSVDFLIVRCVLTPVYKQPVGKWNVEGIENSTAGPPCSEIAKMDCARFMVREAVLPSVSRQTIILRGFSPPT